VCSRAQNLFLPRCCQALSSAHRTELLFCCTLVPMQGEQSRVIHCPQTSTASISLAVEKSAYALFDLFGDYEETARPADGYGRTGIFG
jgi:hypothetical protein